MNNKEIANFLYQYNLWRRGCEVFARAPHPKTLGIYLDEAIEALRMAT